MPIPDSTPLTPLETEQAVYTMLTDEDKLREFKEECEVDFAYGLDGTGRFRVNAFHQRGTVSVVCRAIPFNIRTVEELNLPPVITELAEEERGIILVTGTTGSGKSTTLAAMIDHMNETMSEAHRHDRGPDRVPAPRQAARSSTSARSARTPTPSSARCAASCVRTRT